MFSTQPLQGKPVYWGKYTKTLSVVAKSENNPQFPVFRVQGKYRIWISIKNTQTPASLFTGFDRLR